MEIFYNTVDPNYDQIVEMGPKWWTEYREMDANYRYAGWTLDLMAYFLEKLVQNEFPTTCDEETLKLFERILRIEYDTEMTVEERRRVVSAFWSGNGKMSKTTIEGIVSSYTGQNADIRWEGESLVIDFDNTDTAMVSMSMLQKILRRRMPGHIDYRVRCVATVHIGIAPSKLYWPVRFDQTGTLPNTNIGLSLNKGELDLETEAAGYKSFRMMAGDTAGSAGEFPKTSTGLAMSGEDLATGVSAQGWSIMHQMCGEEILGI